MTLPTAIPTAIDEMEFGAMYLLRSRAVLGDEFDDHTIFVTCLGSSKATSRGVELLTLWPTRATARVGRHGPPAFTRLGEEWELANTAWHIEPCSAELLDAIMVLTDTVRTATRP